MTEVAVSFILGGVIGWLLAVFVGDLEDEGDQATVVIGTIVLTSGASMMLHGSLILTNLIVGFVVANRQTPSTLERLSRQIGTVLPYLFIVFFGLAGAHLKIEALPSLGLVGFVYIVGRTTGLLLGAYLGAVVGGATDMIRKYLGLGILSQAGVAIGLSLIVNQQFQELGLPHAVAIGTNVLTTVTATSVFFEIIGPILTRVALVKSGEARRV